MRYILPLAVLLLAQAGAAWATGDLNTARPGGSFSRLEAESAAACERLCADDTLCMAWSFRDNACELKAIVPAAVTETGVISGVSMRAPTSMRMAATPADVTPAVRIEAEAPRASETNTTVDVALLGGLEPTGELRSRLGN